MKRSVLGVAVATFLAAGLPAAAAPPFGWLDGIATVRDGNAAQGVVPLSGWALDDDGIAAVDVFVDGVIAGRAIYGGSRPDVLAVFPGFPDSGAAGFGFNLDTTLYLNGLHTVSARALSKSGELAFVGGAKQIEFLNVTHDLVPFGVIEAPLINAELFGNCNPADPNRRFSVVSGYALDVGIEANDYGVGYVELLIDGSIYANSRTDCFFSPQTGGLTNCYGLRRLDVAEIYPTVRSAAHSGFRFVLDVGELIADFGFNPGKHFLTIRSGDVSGQVAEIAEVPVIFLCDDFVGNQGSFGFIDIPLEARRAGGVYSGFFQASGWALDWEGVSKVTLLVDGVEQGNANFGLARPDVASLFPGFPDSAGPGWAFALNTTKFANGFHTLQVIVTDDLGVLTLIGEREFQVRNPD